MTKRRRRATNAEPRSAQSGDRGSLNPHSADHSTAGKVEDRLTYRTHLRALSASRADEAARNKSYSAGVALGKHHQSAGLPTAAENAQYDAAASRVAHEDHFDQGYSDGMAAAYERQHAAKARRAAAMNGLIRVAATKRRAS